MVLAGGGDHGPAFLNGSRQRLFHVPIFTRLAGHDGGYGVPVIRRADNHDIDVVSIQYPAEISVGVRAMTPALFHSLPTLGDLSVVHVRQSQALDLIKLQEITQIVPSHASTADQRDMNLVVGRGALGPRPDGGSLGGPDTGPGHTRGDGCGSTDKIAAVDLHNGCVPSSRKGL